MSKRLKYLLAGGAGLLILILAAPLLIPAGAWLGPLQAQASQRLGTTVVIGDLRLALVPLPHLTASKIDIGDGAIRVDSAAVYPALSTLFSAVKTLRSIEVNNLAVSPKGLDMVAALASRPSAGPAAVEIGHLRLKHAEVELTSGKLPPVDLDLELSGMSLVSTLISIDEGKAKLKVDPRGDGWDVDLKASNWRDRKSNV